jgi:FkbM family methyltransferase
VFGIGVGFGTPWLYRAFPEAAFVLIQPLPLFKPSLENLTHSLNCTVLEVALGEDEHRAQLRIPSGTPTGSSLKPRHTAYENVLRADGLERHDDYIEVDVRVLDDINTFDPPYLVKLDVEGAELDALKGGVRTLSQTDLVLAEVSILPRHRGEASLAEFVAFMDAQGFRLFDIPSMDQRGSGGTLVYIDAAFVRKADPRWLGRTE